LGAVAHRLRLDMRLSPDWSRRLPRPLVVPTVIRLKTLADVRKLLKHLPAATSNKATWRNVADRLDEATRGGDIVDVTLPLQIVLSMEGVECHSGSGGRPRSIGRK
jgi:hypothetical protein